MKKPSDLKRCKRCVLPETFPNIRFNEQGICQFCEQSPNVEELKGKKAELKEQIKQEVNKHKGKGHYDCIVAFSGGKDSSYTLKLMTQEYGLRCLAITIDNGFISPQARINCGVITEALGVDHIFYKPAPTFMQRMYGVSAKGQVHSKSAIKRASCLCNSCIQLINNYMIKLALQNGARLIAGGYIGGQVPKDAALLFVDVAKDRGKKTLAMDNYVKNFGLQARNYFSTEVGLDVGYSEVIVINPMLSESVSEDEIVETIKDLGWVKTKDTGKNSSNCQLNDLGIAIHYKQHGFNPYVFEASEQVRHGLMSREEALAKVEAVPEFSQVSWQARKLGLDLNEIAVQGQERGKRRDADNRGGKQEELIAADALLFPGQGAHDLAMLDAVKDMEGFKERYGIVCDALGSFPLQELGKGNVDYVNENKVSSLLTVLVSSMSLDIYRQRSEGEVKAVAGYSVGQYSALYAAGMIDFEQLVMLVKNRAESMDHCFEKVKGAMMAVIGVREEALKVFCEEVSRKAGYLIVSNYNAPGQYSLAGEESAIELALEEIKQLKPKKAIRLGVSGAWHCDLVKPAGEAFRQYLESVDFEQPSMVIIDNVTGKVLVKDSGSIKESLVKHLYRPVQWESTVRVLIEQGCERLLELGYGKVLTKFGFFIDRSVRHQSFFC